MADLLDPAALKKRMLELGMDFPFEPIERKQAREREAREERERRAWRHWMGLFGGSVNAKAPAPIWRNPYCHVSVQIPTSLSARQEDALRLWASISPYGKPEGCKVKA